MPDQKVIELVNIKKIYDMGETRIFALQGVSLTVAVGEMVAIMGSSGSGKSTMLNIIGCLDKPTEGSYFLDGEDVSKLDKDRLAAIRNKRIGFVFQGFNLLGRVKVIDNVQLPHIYAGTEKRIMAASAQEALNWVGLSKYHNHYPTQMSGGQQQRVAIARALVNNPSLILADEPTGALDSKTSLEIIAVLQRLNEEKGITLVIVTHEKEIASYCQRLVVLKDGRVIEDKTISNRRNASRDLNAFLQETEVEE
ncbi:ABC transporter related [Desulfofarcimen acetoxidans DSM 771]|uniref:ABC transporter related n=1 Tax=Desulfofarcimen acetoxidans (strain ATCC 49208 / DSM 771 / KCTC 5769 / VKM B-1644 / 5575) TaxID=485916 RepID=C8W459_DESAS|nr:ABC transporter ATP-binding protein [Desulfofarcimen acetoxidans]ACV61927.1 ABC transporter related [Desulfofarcimen acetoxidans DSM 771]